MSTLPKRFHYPSISGNEPSISGSVEPEWVEARLIEAVRVFARLRDHGVLASESMERAVCGTCGARGDAKCGHAKPAKRITWSKGKATDGPWGDMVQLFSDRYDPHGEGAARVIAEVVMMPRPDRDMQTRAEEAARWLGLVPEGDRALVLRIVRLLAGGLARVPWQRAALDDPGTRGAASAAALKMRYRRALAALAVAVSRESRIS